MLNFINKNKLALIVVAMGFITCTIIIYLFFTIFEVYDPVMDDTNRLLTPVMQDLLEILEKKYK